LVLRVSAEPPADAPLILVVEDDENLRRLVAAFLDQEGYRVREAPDGDTALRLVEETRPDLIVLDLMIPGTDGRAVSRRVGERHGIPVLMLTALSSEEDMLLGFEAGADDYITKPFSPKVLVARVRAILRRGVSGNGESPQVLAHGGLEMNLTSLQVFVDGLSVELTSKEFELLRVFLMNPGRAFSRTELLERVWGFSFLGDSRVVDVHIGHLRRKLGDDASEPGHIRTVRGSGYRLQPAPRDSA
jgi:DNA-binding response OmpR family regulator